jgi:hypothetical protein
MRLIICVGFMLVATTACSKKTESQSSEAVTAAVQLAPAAKSIPIAPVDQNTIPQQATASVVSVDMPTTAQGKVVQILAGEPTYVEVDTGAIKVWIQSANSKPINIGDTVYWNNANVTKNYYADSLQRTFDQMLSVSTLERVETLPLVGEDWISMGSIPGLNNSVSSIVAYRNNVYVSGFFSSHNISTMQGKGQYGVGYKVVAWNGKEWRGLLQSDNYCGETPILAVSPDGELFAGGSRCIGDIKRKNVAMWNGTDWISVGEGVKGEVRALYFDRHGDLYATGSRYKTNDVDSSEGGFVVKWDGKTWKLLGSGILQGEGYALAGDIEGHIYVAGAFDGIGDTSAHNIAMWDGKEWQAMGSGVGGIAHGNEDEVSAAYTVAVNSRGKVYVSGSLGLETWNGKQWEVVDTKASAVIGNVYIDKSDHIYAGLISTCNVEGGPHEGTMRPIQYWDGERWGPFSLVGSNSGVSPGCANGGSVNGFAEDEKGNLYVVGAFADQASGAVNIAKWDGNGWSRLGDIEGVNDLVSQIVVDQNDNLYTLGAFTRTDDTPVARNQVAKWHDGKWDVLEEAPYPIRTMALDSSGTLYIASTVIQGQYRDKATSYISKWDGAKWNQITTIDYIVTDLMVNDQGGIYTCGFTGDEEDHYGAPEPHGLDMWDGKTWTHFPDSNSCHLKRLEPGSVYAQINNQSWQRWDSNGGWTLEGDEKKIAALAQDVHGRLYSIERENHNEGRNFIRVWQPGGVVELGATSIGGIYSMAASNEYIYIGGAFQWLNRKPLPYLARLRIHTEDKQISRDLKGSK